MKIIFLRFETLTFEFFVFRRKKIDFHFEAKGAFVLA